MNQKQKIFKLILISGITFFLVWTLKRVITTADSSTIQVNQKQSENKVKKNNLLVRFTKTHIKKEDIKEYRIEVPLLNQLDEPILRNGCEVTALAMLLSYYGCIYNKNELQDKIVTERYQGEDGLRGDPDIGFVWDATGVTPGAGVNVGPIVELAKDSVNKSLKVVNSSGWKLSELLQIIQEGNPVWTIVTIDYSLQKSEDFMDWPTKNGMKQFSFKQHAAVITGFSETDIFLNDAQGKKIEVNKEDFEKIYNGMGQQSVYIEQIIR